MITGTKHRKTPEEEELSKKLTELEELESELIQSELDLATLHVELRTFEIRYLRIIGARYVELDEINAQIAEFQARLKPKNKNFKEMAEEARTKANESAKAADIEKRPLERERFTPSEDLKKLYREVAKSVHPDLANDEEDRGRRQRLMAEANQAYEEGDEALLEAILREWETSPESVKGEGVGADLVRVIRKITQVKERLKVIEVEIDQLKDSDLYQLKVKVEEAEDEDRDLLEEMAMHLDEQIVLARQELKKMKAKKRRKL